MSTVQFGETIVGDGHPCYVIAEAGSNHNRHLHTGKRLIDEAAAAGANAIKFQTYSGSTLYSKNAPRFDYLSRTSSKNPQELLEDLALPRDWQPLLAEHSRQAGIEFLSSPFDVQAVDELDALDVSAFKIASFEIVDLPFIEYVGSKGRPVILSTGMSTLAEIEEAMDAVRRGGATDICLLQCASVYPAPPSIVNLAAIDTMKAAFKVPVGISDHTQGIHISIAAAARGCAIIEKHFTLDRSHPGPDHPFAIEPHQLRELVHQVQDVEAAIGDGMKRGPSDEEAREMYTKARRSVVAATDIDAGTTISRDMLTVKRPGFGIKPRLIEAIIGRKASRAIEEDEVITWDML